jgi:hypothetical protein
MITHLLRPEKGEIGRSGFEILHSVHYRGQMQGESKAHSSLVALSAQRTEWGQWNLDTGQNYGVLIAW